MTKLYEYQKQGVSTIIKHNGRVLLADEMGLGKTLQSLEYIKQQGLPLTIVICPAHLKWVWEHEARKHLKISSEILEGIRPKKINPLYVHKLIIINYDILRYWIPYLKNLNPEIVIIDEVHYQKSRTAIRTKSVHKLCRKISKIIAISGTPLVNRPAELYTTLHLLWPKLFPSFWSFAFRYCQPTRKPWGWEFKGASHLKELHRKLKRLGMIRRLKADVLSELPEKIRKIVYLPIQKKSEYKQATDNFIQWLSSISLEKASKAIKAEKLVKLGYLKRLAARLKRKYIYQWIDDFLESSDDKLVVYCTHKKMIARLHKRYKTISVVIEGRTPKKKRRLAVKSFQTDRNIRLFLGNIRAAGTGITLTAASNLAFVELDWAPGNHTQAEDRIHRIGQKNSSNIYYLIAKNTIEEYLCEIIQKKQKVVSSILDGKNKMNLDMINYLENKLLKGKKTHGTKRR